MVSCGSSETSSTTQDEEVTETPDTTADVPDTDGDGIADSLDAFPSDPSESVDSDSDGIGDNTDPDNSAAVTDTDGDGVKDISDNCDSLSNADQADADGDLTGDVCDTDDDNDGTLDESDSTPTDTSVDSDADGVSNSSDADDDGDGINDVSDAFPADATESADADHDGTGDNADTDDDNDGILDVDDVDSDGDGIENPSDNCPSASNVSQIDTDADGLGDSCDDDDDADSIADALDNCSLVANSSQSNFDADGYGDDCDGDDDGDGVADSLETVSGGSTSVDDGDGDGFSEAQGDCNDSSSTTYSTASELCNGIDDNCDGTVDEPATYYADADGDGYGNVSVSSVACDVPAGYVTNSTDCNDASNLASPGIATETCDDGLDNNCNGTVDDPSTYYSDSDGDGYGNASAATSSCTQPSGTVLNNTDCDDATSSRNPGMTEVCDSLDNNCDGSVDEGVTTLYYRDYDSDSYGTGLVNIYACSAPSGYVSRSGDCKDAIAAINPDAAETCNSVDENCNQFIDDMESSSSSTITFYQDQDIDGYGNSSVSKYICDNATAKSKAVSLLYIAADGDCNDTTNTINPAASEVCADGVDSDCDGSDNPVSSTICYQDSDSDNYGNASVSESVDTCSSGSCPSGFVTDATDCDDGNASMHIGCAAVTEFNTSDSSLGGSLALPCSSGMGSYTLPIVFEDDSDTNGFAGCAYGTSKGFYRTTNGGASWSKVSGTVSGQSLSDMVVYDIEKDSAGDIYLCGSVGSGANKTYIAKYTVASATYSSVSKKSDFGAYYPDDCKSMKINSAGEIIFTRRADNYMYFYDGSTWTRNEGWDSDTTSNYPVYEIEMSGDDFYATGSSITYPAYFFSPRSSGAAYEMDVNTIDSALDAEGFAIESLSATDWLAGISFGYSTANLASTSSLYYSHDGGISWSDAVVHLVDSGYYISNINDIACKSGTDICLAVGSMANSSSGSIIGGYLLMSTDGGETWYEYQNAMLAAPELFSADMYDIAGISWNGNRFWILGWDILMTGVVE